MMSPEIDLKKTKAIVIANDILISLMTQTKALEIIKKANEKGIPVLIKCSLQFEYSQIQEIIENHKPKLNVILTNTFEFDSDLKNKTLQKNDCFLVMSENDLNSLSDKIGRPPAEVKRGAPQKKSTTLQSTTSTTTIDHMQELKKAVGNRNNSVQKLSILSENQNDKPEKIQANVSEDRSLITPNYRQELTTVLQKKDKPVQQLSIYSEIQKNTPEKIQAIVFEDDVFTSSPKYSYIIADIIKIANDKNILVFIRCATSDSFIETKKITDAHKLKVIIKDQSDFNEMFKKNVGFTKDDCLYISLPNGTLFNVDTTHRPKKTLITSEDDFKKLSTTVENQPKNILLPENQLLANIIKLTYSLEKTPSITLENEHLLSITLDKTNIKLYEECKNYNPDLKNTAVIEIKSRGQIEKFVNTHCGDVAKLYDDAQLKYSPMPEVIRGIVIEHDLLFHFPKHNEANSKPAPNKYQLNIICLIKKAFNKGIPVIVRCSNDAFFGDLSTLLYSPEHQFNWDKLPIMNQSDFNQHQRKADELNRDDFLYVAISNGNLYETDTGKRTHVLLILLEYDLNYLSEQIENYDASMLSLENMRVAKNVRNICDASKIPSVQLVNEDSLHIITCDKENKDAQIIAKHYKEKYGENFVMLDKSGKIIKISSRDTIEKFVKDHGSDVRKLYDEANFPFNNNNNCNQQ